MSPKIVVVTGASYGMGAAIVKKFMNAGFDVIGLDILPSPLSMNQEFLDAHVGTYCHIICNVTDKDSLPDLNGVNILINNAGVQATDRDIDINLKGTINCTEKYALRNPNIVSVLNQADASATTGANFGSYVASKGGIVSYTRWVAKAIAKFGATCNSLSVGGVMTDSNDIVTDDLELWQAIMQQTPLRRWATENEVADWVYFLTAINKSCSGQDIIIDNLESLNNNFIWKAQDIGEDM